MSEQEGEEDVGHEEEAFGYSKKGSWSEVVEFAKKVTSAFENAGIDPEIIDDWESWRPRSKEEEEEMREKTAEKAKVSEGESPSEKVGEAAEHISKTQKHTAEGEVDKAAEKGQKAAKSAGEAVGSAGRDVIRTVEDWVYKNITTKTSPLYLDTPNFNASLSLPSYMAKRIKGIIGKEDEEEYTLSIQPQSDDVEEALDDEFRKEDEED